MPSPSRTSRRRPRRTWRPATPTEEVLAAVWREVLGVERVGAGDSFPDLGGHSLLAMRMTAEVLARLDVELPLRVVFEAPRLRDLAARIDRLRDEALAALLAELGVDLSPEELEALLEPEGLTTPAPLSQ